MFMYCVLTFNVKARDICCCTVMVAKEAVSDPSLWYPYDIPPIHSNIKIYIYICKYIYMVIVDITVISHYYHIHVSSSWSIYNIIQYYLIVQTHSGFSLFFLHMFYLLQDDYICIVGWLLCGILPFNISGIITIHYGNFYITSIFRDDVAGFEHCSNVEENTWVGHGWAFRPFWDLIRN